MLDGFDPTGKPMEELKKKSLTSLKSYLWTGTSLTLDKVMYVINIDCMTISF